MAGINVDHEQLREQATALDASEVELTTILDRISGQITELISTGFVTESASGSFGAAYETWKTSARTCFSTLQEMRNYLNSTSEAFAQTDTATTINF